MTYRLVVALLLLAAVSPAVAESHHSTGAHMRPQLFHDRSPRMHNHGAQPHHPA